MKFYTLKHFLTNNFLSSYNKKLAIDISAPKKFFDDLKTAGKDLLIYAGQAFSILLGVASVGVLIWLIFKCIMLSKQGHGDDIPKMIGFIVIDLIVGAILFSFGVTGWGLIK